MDKFDILSGIISSRRTCKPAQMNGKKIADEVIIDLLRLADWAPTHAHTEPWRFVVYSGNAVKQFGEDHAAMYMDVTPEEKFIKATFDKLLHNGDHASHIIACIMKRGDNPKIPAIEETAAVAAGIEHILLGATALGIASFWSTGGLTHHEAMKTYFDLGPDDMVMGLLFLGYTDDHEKNGVRIVPLKEKIKWIS